MQKVCAWCKKTLFKDIKGKTNPSEITHSICHTCADKIFSEKKVAAYKFIDQLESPVVVVDSDVVVKMANQTARKFLGKELPAIEGFRGGNVFECVYASLPQGCGKTVHCSGCTIRQTVTETYKTGKGVSRVPVFIHQNVGQTIKKIPMLISTEKVGSVVLLKIDEIDSAPTS